MMRRSMILLALAGAAAPACDYPTSPPQWDQTWVVPGDTIDVGVAELLPATVALNEDTTAFVAEVPEASTLFWVGALCGDACASIYGLVAPKPVFAETLTTSTSLPEDVVMAVLTGGEAEVTLGHSFQFDPLRPTADPAGWDGYIAVRVTSDGAVVAEDSISGHDTAFPPGSTLSPTLTIQPATVTGELQMQVAIFSPEGDETTVERSDTLGVTLAATVIEISEVTVTASSVTIDPTSTTMDFGGLEQDGVVLDQIESGALRLDVHNPFEVTGTMTVEFRLPGQTIQRSLQIQTLPAGEESYRTRVEFSGDEIRSILGSDEVELIASGSVSATDGTVTVTPRQALILETAFELVLLIGGSEDG